MFPGILHSFIAPTKCFDQQEMLMAKAGPWHPFYMDVNSFPTLFSDNKMTWRCEQMQTRICGGLWYESASRTNHSLFCVLYIFPFIYPNITIKLFTIYNVRYCFLTFWSWMPSSSLYLGEVVNFSFLTRNCKWELCIGSKVSIRSFSYHKNPK